MADIINCISYYTKGLKSSNKRIKVFKYLKSKIFNDGLYVYKKLTLQRILGINGKMTSKENYTFHMALLTLVVS